MSKRVALYAGSFDPYTNGHHAVVRKSAELFDEVVVLIGVNVLKQRRFDAQAMADAMRAALAADGIRNARVVLHDGLVMDYCAEHGIRWYVRGLRSGTDYAYEEASAQANRLINPSVETIYMRADDTALSSSMVRELLAFDKSVASFVPPPVLELIQR